MGCPSGRHSTTATLRDGLRPPLSSGARGQAGWPLYQPRRADICVLDFDFWCRYPVRVAQLVVVDANVVARIAIKGVKALLSKKLSARLISINSAELPEHFKMKELPPFLGDGANREDSVSYHARHAARRRKLDAALCKAYGYKFEATPSDTALWVDVSGATATPRPAAAVEEESDEEDAIPVQRYVPKARVTLL